MSGREKVQRFVSQSGAGSEWLLPAAVKLTEKRKQGNVGVLLVSWSVVDFRTLMIFSKWKSQFKVLVS